MTSFRKPVISRTFNSFPALRSGSAGGSAAPLLFIFRCNFLTHFPGYSAVSSRR